MAKVPNELRVQAIGSLVQWLVSMEIPFLFEDLSGDVTIDPNNEHEDMQCTMLENLLSDQDGKSIRMTEAWGDHAFEIRDGTEDIVYELVDRGHNKPAIEVHYRDL